MSLFTYTNLKSLSQLSGRSHFGDDERMMRRDGDWDDMPRGRYGY